MICLNYYYDIDLNFDMDNVWEFYEWEESDVLTFIKKIPLFRVSHETLCDFLKYHIKVSKEFVSSIAHQTQLYKKEDIYASFLMSDTKNSLAVLLNEEGEVIALSKVLVRDDNNINEFMYTLKETELSYDLLSLRKKRCGLRQENSMKKLISVELQTLLEENNEEKLQYLYYEWFQKEGTSLKAMYEEMNLNLNFSSYETLSRISYLIRLSYHQV